MKHRTILLLTVTGTALVVVSGAAFAQALNTVDRFQQEPSTPKCDGTDQPDAITGTEGIDETYALASDDQAYANGGADKVYGAAGNDNLYGDDRFGANQGNDEVYGGPGAEGATYGFGGADLLSGGGGNDYLDAREDIQNAAASPGEDIVKGGGATT